MSTDPRVTADQTAVQSVLSVAKTVLKNPVDPRLGLIRASPYVDVPKHVKPSLMMLSTTGPRPEYSSTGLSLLGRLLLKPGTTRNNTLNASKRPLLAKPSHLQV